MTSSGRVDLALGILDHQLLDREGRRCGKVDDLELEGVADGRPRVSAIVTGPGGLRGRGRLGRLVARLSRGRTVLIPWADVAEVRSGVQLRRSAKELRLGRGDDRARAWVERIPGSSL
jgi:hypothetical protein